jgi:hypothetical protein
VNEPPTVSELPDELSLPPRAFHPVTNLVARVLIVGVLLGAVVTVLGGWALENSAYATNQDVTIEQPVPFSHEHHVGGLGIDCRYCHTSVETSAYAGIPPTKTCMSCHSQIWNGSPMLEPVRDSWESGGSIPWVRVHALPDYVYFNHSIHVAKGIGCVSCHGQVDQMRLMRQASPLTMSWCLECHREPEKFIRPRDKIFELTNLSPTEQADVGPRLVKEYHVRPLQALTECATCHR